MLDKFSADVSVDLIDKNKSQFFEIPEKGVVIDFWKLHDAAIEGLLVAEESKPSKQKDTAADKDRKDAKQDASGRNLSSSPIQKTSEKER